MRKRVYLISVLSIFILILGKMVSNQYRMAQFIVGDGMFSVDLKVNAKEEKILPWYDEDRQLYYFFFPSCLADRKLYFDSIDDGNIVINNFVIDQGSCLTWEQGEIYTFEIAGGIYQITFMKSENIPAFFIETESGSMDYLHEDKENEEEGTLAVLSPEGDLQYNGKLTRISGRGNSTWIQVKKPYTITLTDQYPLCGLSAGKEWKLLSLYFEHDKIHSKIIFDLGREMGIENTPECTWIDLYCHGEYKGLYLLTEDISSKQVPEDKYLIETTIPQQLQADESCISTEKCGYMFRFAKPHYPTPEQVEESENAIRVIENLLVEKDSRYVNYVDMSSIAKQFLIDKIVMDVDGMTMSTFFYLKEGRISAGPLWDYDRAMGTILSDYRAPIEDNPNGMYGWYMSLYENEDFYETMVQCYIEFLPYFQKVIEDIDYYAAYISASVKMDSVLMRNLAKPNETVSYQQYESYVKYLKYFLANRLNFLGDLWQIDGVDFQAPESAGTWHKVEFAAEDGTILDIRYVRDGECIENVPVLDVDEYWGWFFHEGTDYRGKLFHYLIPVYEDAVLYAKKR